MIVVDANVAIRALLVPGQAGERARNAMAQDPDWWAPAGFHGEVLAVFRGVGATDPALADAAANVLIGWTVNVVSSKPLLSRVWELRHNVSMFDAFYVAAAEHLDCTLLTADRKLAAATGPRCVFATV